MFSVVASHYTLTQNELPLFPELLLLSFLKSINPMLKNCNLKFATFACFWLFFSILTQKQIKIGKSYLLQIAISQLWIDEFLENSMVDVQGKVGAHFEPKYNDLLPLKTFLFNVKANFRCKIHSISTTIVDYFMVDQTCS